MQIKKKYDDDDVHEEGK